MKDGYWLLLSAFLSQLCCRYTRSRHILSLKLLHTIGMSRFLAVCGREEGRNQSKITLSAVLPCLLSHPALILPPGLKYRFHHLLDFFLHQKVLIGSGDTYTDIYTHKHTDTHTQIHRYIHTQTHRHTNTQTHKHTDTYKHEHTETQTHIHMETYTHQSVGNCGHIVHGILVFQAG